MINTSIASLAVLKVNWDKGHDYVDNFVPFALEAISKSDLSVISVSAVQTYIKDNFGLRIPQGALNTILRRIAGQGYLQKQTGVYVRTKKEIETDISTAKAEAMRQQRALFAKLATFANKEGRQSWSVDDAGNALLAYLETEFIPILAAHLNGQLITTPTTNPTNSQLTVNEFVVEINEKDPEMFSFLETVTKGHMIATALFLPDISKTSQKFHDLTVFLDTKILLTALGFEGKGAKEYSTELLNLLYESNITLSCFDITLDEVKGILTAAQHFLRNPREVSRPFLVYENFLESGFTPSDVDLIIVNLELTLKRLRIFTKERPAYSAHLGLDERRLQQLLQVEMPDQHNEAQRHDMSCLTAIHRLRNGRVSTNIETCKYLFITPNNKLAKASSIFFNEHYGQSNIPLCINDHTLATLAWVKHPELDNGLQRTRLISTAYAAIQPSPQLWKQYLKEIERLKAAGNLSDNDYHLLRFSTVAKTALVETTRGEVGVFTEGTIPEIIELARADARRETEIRLHEEIGKRENAEHEVLSTHQRLLRTNQNIEQRLENVSFVFGKGVKVTTYIFGFSLIPIGMYQAHSLPVNDSLKISFPLFLQTTLVIALGFALWSQFTGGSVREIGRKIEMRSANWLKDHLIRFFSNNNADQG